MLFKRIITLLLLVIFFNACTENQKGEIVKLEGLAFGTTYHITYFNQNQINYTKSIDSLFNLVNKSMSTYIADSDISRINAGETNVIIDDYFREVFQKSLAIYNETEGKFDPTLGILVNAWGFGPEKPLKELDTAKVNRLMQLVGFNKVRINNSSVVKNNDSIYFDFNAIAKGYAVDVVGRFLESKNIDNYLVEVGGELRARGKNTAKNKPWKVGIENPNFDGTRSIEKIIELRDEAMATSGNYRKFRTDSITGKKYAHIINSETGYPTQNNLLSVSVIASLDCADVDAYATALMAMSLEEAKNFLDRRRELKAIIIYIDDDGSVSTFTSSNF